MGLLNKASVYLAGPIQYATDGASWRDMVTNELEALGIRVFNPLKKPFTDPAYKEDEFTIARLREWENDGRFDLIEEKMKLIRSSDLFMCDRADFSIFYLNPKIFTVGTIEELVQCNRLKRPCYVMWDGPSVCFWLLGMFSHKYIFNDWESLLGEIRAIDAGRLQPDPSRWKLLTEEYR